MNFNEKLIELRKSKGLSQDELGLRLRLSVAGFQKKRKNLISCLQVLQRKLCKNN